MLKKITIIALVSMFYSFSVSASQNLIIVTIDGLRWQEAFNGADEKLINNQDFVKDTKHLVGMYLLIFLIPKEVNYT